MRTSAHPSIRFDLKLLNGRFIKMGSSVPGGEKSVAPIAPGKWMLLAIALAFAAALVGPGLLLNTLVPVKHRAVAPFRLARSLTRSLHARPDDGNCLPGQPSDLEELGVDEDHAVDEREPAVGMAQLPVKCCVFFSYSLKVPRVATLAKTPGAAISIGLPRGPPALS